jgi:predicted enzyme related to lactoylglutathione lyase
VERPEVIAASALRTACLTARLGNNAEARASESASPVFRDAGISYLRIPAPDARKTAGFYQHIFGWTIDANQVDPSFEDGTGHVIGHFVPDGAVAGEAGFRPYVYVDSIDDAIGRVAAHGGAVREEPYPEGDLWIATVRNPAGNVIGVWQRGPRH